MNWNNFAPLGFVAAVVAVAPAHAATIQPFTASAFEAAQRQDRPILVNVYADWCPVCRAQHKALSEILPKAEFKNLAVFNVNFDRQQDVWSKFGVRGQSTLIIFRGRREAVRSVGATDPAAIEQLLRASLG